MQFILRSVISWHRNTGSSWNQPVSDSVSQQHSSEEQKSHFLERNCKTDSLYVETCTSSRWISARVWDKIHWGHCASTAKPSPTPKPPTLQFCHYYCNSTKGCFLLSSVNQKSYLVPTQIPDVAEPAQTWENTRRHTHPTYIQVCRVTAPSSSAKLHKTKNKPKKKKKRLADLRGRL